MQVLDLVAQLLQEGLLVVQALPLEGPLLLKGQSPMPVLVLHLQL